jgi:hypothetical protein
MVRILPAGSYEEALETAEKIIAGKLRRGYVLRHRQEPTPKT